MIENIKIRNFRCFDNIDIDTRKFNLVAGKNNVGKTALLEAFFMMAGAHNPETALKVDAFRGKRSLTPDVGDLFRWLFKDGDMAKKVSINTLEKDGTNRDLSVYVDEKSKTEISRSKIDGASQGISESLEEDKCLIFEYKDNNNRDFKASSYISGSDIEFEKSEKIFHDSVMIKDSGGADQAYVDRYSEIEDVKSQDIVIDALEIIEPRIEDLRVSSSGGSSSLKADIGGDRLVPIRMMGGGVSRLARIAINLAKFQSGLVLIDEVEQGFHYSVLEDVWRSINHISKVSNNQIIATTHSLECIKAAHNILGDSFPDDFVLHRLEKHEDTIESVQIDSDSLSSSLKHGFEIR